MAETSAELVIPQLVLITLGRKIIIWTEARPRHELLAVLDWQRRHYPDSAPRHCPFCRKGWLQSDRAPAGIADCLHVEDDRHWWTADLFCKTCLSSPGLLVMAELYLEQCSGLELEPGVPNMLVNAAMGAPRFKAPEVLH